jgi:hypothetical protein
MKLCTHCMMLGYSIVYFFQGRPNEMGTSQAAHGWLTPKGRVD